MSAKAAPFVPLAESEEVQEAAEVLVERIIARGEDARGVALPTLSTPWPTDALARLDAAVSLQRWWRARRTELVAAHDALSPAASAVEEAPVAATAAAPSRTETAPETLQGQAEELLRSRLVGRWGVLHGLQKKPL